MDRESPDVIEHEMQQTRESLTQKVAALETQVLGTIQNATDTVNSIVDTVKAVVPETLTNVKDTVNETVTTVKQQVASAFDVSQHTRENPWAMVGGAAALGFVTGLLVFRPSHTSLGTAAGHGDATHGPAHARGGYVPQPVMPAAHHDAGPRIPGWLDNLLAPLAEKAGQELKRIGEAALASAAGSLRQAVETKIPQLIDQGGDRLLGTVGHQPDPAAGPRPGYRNGADI